MKVKSESEVAQSCPILRNPTTRLLHPWDFPGKSTGVGNDCLLSLPLVFFLFLVLPNFIHCKNWKTKVLGNMITLRFQILLL